MAPPGVKRLDLRQDRVSPPEYRCKLTTLSGLFTTIFGLLVVLRLRTIVVLKYRSACLAGIVELPREHRPPERRPDQHNQDQGYG